MPVSDPWPRYWNEALLSMFDGTSNLIGRSCLDLRVIICCSTITHTQENGKKRALQDAMSQQPLLSIHIISTSKRTRVRRSSAFPPSHSIDPSLDALFIERYIFRLWLASMEPCITFWRTLGTKIPCEMVLACGYYWRRVFGCSLKW
jgi:hypothetical protein